MLLGNTDIESPFGISFIIMLSEQPVGIAGVMPYIFSLLLASSRIVFPKTSW